MRNKLIGLVALLLFFCVIQGCRKADLKSDQPLETSQSLKNVIQKFNETFTKKATLIEQEKIAGIFQNLNYNNGAIVSLGADSTLYIIQTVETTQAKTEKFVVIAAGKNDYYFDGIYEAKNLNAIKSIFSVKSLPANDFVLVKGLNAYPIKEWISDASGILHYRENRSSSIKDIAKLKQSLMSDIRTNNVHEDQPCIYWYWWEYFPDYGWIPVDFLYSTGCDGDGGSGGGGNEPEEIDPEPMYVGMLDQYAEGTEEDQSFNASSSSADGIDAVAGSHSWIVGKHPLGQWSVTADTKYSYYHTEYFDANLMRMVQNYDATYYKTEAIHYVGSNFLINSAWSTTTLTDQILNNNTEDAKGKTVVTGLVTHSMRIRFKYKGIDVDKTISSTTHVGPVQLELKFN